MGGEDRAEIPPNCSLSDGDMDTGIPFFSLSLFSFLLHLIQPLLISRHTFAVSPPKAKAQIDIMFSGYERF